MIEHNNIDKTVETLNSLNYDLFMEDGSAPGVVAMMDGYINNNSKYIKKMIEDETIVLVFIKIL